MAIAATPTARVLDPWSQTLVRFDQMLRHTAPRAGGGNSSTSIGGQGGMQFGEERLLTSPAIAINPRFSVQYFKYYQGTSAPYTYNSKVQGVPELLKMYQRRKMSCFEVFNTSGISMVVTTTILPSSHDSHSIVELYLVLQSQPLDLALPCGLRI